MVARLVAHDFGVLLNHVSDEHTIANAAQSLLASLIEPYDIDGQCVQVQVSMGIAFYPNHGNSPEQLFNNAEIALRQAKTQDCQQLYTFYTLEMSVLEDEKQLMQRQLELALDRQELHLYYQPQVNLITGRIIGAEALLRWNHSAHGWLHSDAFLTNIENSATELAIEQWALKTACVQTTAWQVAIQLPLRVAINVSTHHFHQDDLVATVATILQQTGLPADQLVLELTEACVMAAVGPAVFKLKELKAIGVQIALDGFGTGFSSLNYLKRFPLDILKIDKSFIQKMTTDTNDAAIAKTIIAIGQSLQLKVIAEGVETAAQFNLLRQSGCYAMQGDLFSGPMLASDLQAFLATDKRFESSAALAD